jgi:8-oxo-dGTP pyrophosphatase MutT (NUDIX family)
VILLRSEPFEVLLVRRNPASRFMGGVWVFPGGALAAGETHRAAGVRELAEEAGVALPDPAALVEFSRWITPAQFDIRFDTWFFLALAPPGAAPEPDGGETVDARWFAPAEALAAQARGEIELVFPTIKHLEMLVRFDSAPELLAWAAQQEVRPVEPRVVRDVARPVLPGEPGYGE